MDFLEIKKNNLQLVNSRAVVALLGYVHKLRQMLPGV